MALEFVCGDPECTFEITSVTADEIVDHVRLHAREMHDKDIDEDRVRERIRED